MLKEIRDILILSWWLVAASVCFAAEVEQPDLEPFRGQLITEITVAGNRVTRDWIITREIWTSVGEGLDPKLVSEDITRLENLGVFGSVLARPNPHAGGVALVFSVTEMPWIIPYPAIGYNEENGFSLGLGVASPNFAGRDISMSGSAAFGGTRQYKFTGSNPWIAGNHVSAGVSYLNRSRTNQLLDFQQTSNLATASVGRYLGRSGRLNLHAGYYQVASDKPGKTLSPDNLDRLWFGEVALGFDGRDSWSVPHDGWQVELDLLYMGGEADSWNWTMDVRRFQPVSDRQTVATGPFLALQSGTVGRDIPPYLQYFAGGANSIRGYHLEDLGREIYGQNQLLYNLEYRYLLVPPGPVKILRWWFSIGLELAAFCDAGVAWSRPGDLNLDRTRSGYGVGLRLLVPGLECLRFDVARSEFGDTVFNFGVKSVFDGRQERVR